ncbi:hypothetical protein NE686_10085 [Tissierella carlieri]|uniref:Uncharacterized protein n=1 Tax=Tissierella carlieri TaxID=689904 RepID=A0ABT1SAD4_9FIRM|nr:hypothetical protein [Tissierella carlieri]MCQ4923435.1 hypothetical protein [Tissierella carlieri]
MKRRKLLSVVILMFLLFNLSVVAFAGGDGGPIRPRITSYLGGYEEEPEYPVVSSCGGDGGPVRVD